MCTTVSLHVSMEDTIETASPLSPSLSSSSSIIQWVGGDGDSDSDEATIEHERDILRQTVTMMSDVLVSKEREIEVLQDKRKRQRGGSIRKKSRHEECEAECIRCLRTLPLESYDRTSMNKTIRAEEGTQIRRYEYRRQICKGCNKEARRLRKRLIKII